MQSQCFENLVKKKRLIKQREKDNPLEPVWCPLRCYIGIEWVTVVCYMGREWLTVVLHRKRIENG